MMMTSPSIISLTTEGALITNRVSIARSRSARALRQSHAKSTHPKGLGLTSGSHDDMVSVTGRCLLSGEPIRRENSQTGRVHLGLLSGAARFPFQGLISRHAFTIRRAACPSATLTPHDDSGNPYQRGP